MEMNMKDLLAERNNLEHECKILREEVCRQKEKNEKLQTCIETLRRNAEELHCALSRAEGCAEAYAHCIDAMNGIQHEKKVGFRHADG